MRTFPSYRTIVSIFLVTACTFASTASDVRAQSFPTDDPVIKKMWEIGMEKSMTTEFAHQLLDVIGPRLAGSENLAAAQDYLVDLYASWGVPARKEEYGTWRGWRQGILHVDMIEPRVSTMEAELMAWSPPTDGPVEAEVVLVPEGLTEENASEWLQTIKGKFVMASAPELMCRAETELEEYARPETIERLNNARGETMRNWMARVAPLGNPFRLGGVLDQAGAAGVLTSRWSGGWGVNKISSTSNKNAVAVDLSCEDYSLLFRLLENGTTPVLRINATSEDLGIVPQFNVVAELKGSEFPDEYVLLGAHLDSWHAATGATDNGTGTITMLEAMRILKEAYPNPRRTILVGHWGAEEMGLIGSGSFRDDHPEVMEGLQAAFNQDNGTWRFEIIEGQGFADADRFIPKWMSVVPTEISSHIDLQMPGTQSNSGSDHSSFVCAGVPSFRFQSPYTEYRTYTWHTNRDTYDKIVFDDLKENATLAAMIAYQAANDDEKMGRDKVVLPINPRTGEPRPWPTCRPPSREAR